MYHTYSVGERQSHDRVMGLTTPSVIRIKAISGDRPKMIKMTPPASNPGLALPMIITLSTPSSRSLSALRPLPRATQIPKEL